MPIYTKEEIKILDTFCNPIEWLNQCEESMQKWLDEYNNTKSKEGTIKDNIEDILHGYGL